MNFCVRIRTVGGVGMRQRLYEIDLFRIIACIAVIITHCTAFILVGPVDDMVSLILVTTNRVMSFAVPAFIFISGFSLYGAYGQRQVTIRTFTVKRVTAVLLPYLLWANIYFLIYILTNMCTYTPELYFKHLLLGKMSYHLYFIPIIIQFYILFIPIKWVVKKIDSLWVIGGSLVLYLIYYFSFKNIIPFSDRFFMTYFPFFMLGIYTSSYFQSRKVHILHWQKVSIYIIGAAMTFLYGVANFIYYGFGNPVLLRIPLLWTGYCLIVIFALFILCRERVYVLPKIPLIHLAKLTMTVYFCHPLVITLVNRVIKILNIDSISVQATMKLLITIPLSFVVAYVYEWTSQHIKSIIDQKRESYSRPVKMNREL